MKKIVSVLLALVFLFCAAPFAFAADNATKDAVRAYGYFTPKNTDGSLLYVVMDSAYSKTTKELSATVTVQNGIDRRQTTLPADKLLAERVSFAAGEGTELCPKVTLGMPEERPFTEKLTFTSRLLRETRPLPQKEDLQVGAGDTLHLKGSCALPFAFQYGGTRVAAAAGGGTAEKDIKATTVGSKTISLCVFSYVLTEHSFEVRKQTDLYRDAVLGFYEYIGTLLLSPVIAPISSFLTGPLNIAAMLSPAQLFKINPAEVFKLFFSVFNLIRP